MLKWLVVISAIIAPNFALIRYKTKSPTFALIAEIIFYLLLFVFFISLFTIIFGSVQIPSHSSGLPL